VERERRGVECGIDARSCNQRLVNRGTHRSFRWVGADPRGPEYLANLRRLGRIGKLSREDLRHEWELDHGVGAGRGPRVSGFVSVSLP
jgi:hypothetical protein